MCSKFYFHHDEDITRVLEQFKLTNDSCLKFVWGIFVGGALCGGAFVAVPLTAAPFEDD